MTADKDALIEAQGRTLQTLTKQVIALGREVYKWRVDYNEMQIERDVLARAKLSDQAAYLAMRDERDALRADAERYQWLCQAPRRRVISEAEDMIYSSCFMDKEAQDAAIDLAMKGKL